MEEKSDNSTCEICGEGPFINLDMHKLRKHLVPFPGSTKPVKRWASTGKLKVMPPLTLEDDAVRLNKKIPVMAGQQTTKKYASESPQYKQEKYYQKQREFWHQGLDAHGNEFKTELGRKASDARRRKTLGPPYPKRDSLTPFMGKRDQRDQFKPIVYHAPKKQQALDFHRATEQILLAAQVLTCVAMANRKPEEENESD